MSLPLPPEIFGIIKNAWEFSLPVTGPILRFLKSWGWFFVPLILWGPFKFLWLWWRIEGWLGSVYKPILLEIKLPKDSLKPIRAMENVITSIHQVVYQPPDWWEKWVDGQIQTSVFLEMVSDAGDIHFFLRAHADYRQAIEASVFAQFPEAEISLAQDYAKLVPADMPNKDWDLFGSDYKMNKKEDWYPIRTYTSFETETESEEEKRVDPVASLLEAMSKLGPGEHYWVQFITVPVYDKDEPEWRKALPNRRPPIIACSRERGLD